MIVVVQLVQAASIRMSRALDSRTRDGLYRWLIWVISCLHLLPCSMFFFCFSWSSPCASTVLLCPLLSVLWGTCISVT